MALPNKSAFTLKSNGGLLRVLVTDLRIHIPSSSKFVQIRAIWDTGATGSAITKKTVQQLGLAPSGMARVNTANGIATQKTYTIDLGLPNSVLIQSIIATEIDALTAGSDALIGMDVITLGVLSITNHKGITCMSFRFPSLHEIDYVKNLNYGLTPIKTYQGGSNFTMPKKRRNKFK